MIRHCEYNNKDEDNNPRIRREYNNKDEDNNPNNHDKTIIRII